MTWLFSCLCRGVGVFGDIRFEAFGKVGLDCVAFLDVSPPSRPDQSTGAGGYLPIESLAKDPWLVSCMYGEVCGPSDMEWVLFL